MFGNKIEKIKSKKEIDLFKRPNVNSVGIGYKMVNGEPTEELAIIVGVDKKVSKDDLNESEIIPNDVGGIKTDIVELGNLKPQFNPMEMQRPVVPGISIGHKDVSAGTLGCIAYKKEIGKVFLSNNHVLANTNEAQIGDEIWQPATSDGGTVLHKVGSLRAFVPLKFNQEDGWTGKVLSAVFSWFNKKIEISDKEPPFNDVDAAIGDICVPINHAIPEIGIPKGITEPKLGMTVKKFGRTTKLTKGKIIQMNASVSIDYGKPARFRDQMILTKMSDCGDSGSVLLNDDNYIVGLIFAGSDKVSIATPIHKVLQALGLSIPSEPYVVQN